MIDFGHGVFLDNINPNFLEQLRQWRNQPEIWKWCRQNDLISMWDQRVWAENLTSSPTSKMYQIIAQIDPPRVIVPGKDMPKNAPPELKTVGVCGFSDINNHHQRAEFSIYVAPEHQRRGFGEKALRTLFSHGFFNLNLHGIYGDVFDGNDKALHLLTEKIGMAKEGVRRQFYFKSGRHINATTVSLLRTEWPWL